ncbi:MAG: hypothetical protein JO040_08160 [Gemmatimonadetes bacterium]|nr:hypothetical protein [Gemmatimonadota bacterium]
MIRRARYALALFLVPLAAASAAAEVPAPSFSVPSPTPGSACGLLDFAHLRRNPTPGEMRCHYGIRGPGRFGLASYMDVPVYQPATPLPGNHVVGIPGMPGPRPGETYEEWEWRVLRTQYGPEAQRVHRGLDVLDPIFAGRIMRLERALAEAGVHAARRETWRSPERQAFIFQQGRSRPGSFATSTLTSWHSRVDGRGHPAGRAVDYDVPGSQMGRFHEIVRQVGLESYGADSNDPGHVFLPGDESMTMREMSLLRLLPRVPVVTIATGRPESENATRDVIQQFRELARAFINQPLAATPLMELVVSSLRAPTVHSSAAVAALTAAPAPTPAPAAKAGRRRGSR